MWKSKGLKQCTGKGVRYIKDGAAFVQVLAIPASLLELLQVGTSLLCIMPAEGCPSCALRYFVLCANTFSFLQNVVLHEQGESCSVLVLRACHPSSVAFAKAPATCSEQSSVA